LSRMQMSKVQTVENGGTFCPVNFRRKRRFFLERKKRKNQTKKRKTEAVSPGAGQGPSQIPGLFRRTGADNLPYRDGAFENPIDGRFRSGSEGPPGLHRVLTVELRKLVDNSERRPRNVPGICSPQYPNHDGARSRPVQNASVPGFFAFRCVEVRESRNQEEGNKGKKAQ